MDISPIDVAKNYLSTSPEYSHMQDGEFTVTEHNKDLDAHMVNQLDGVNHDDTFDDQYDVVTVHKNIDVGQGFTIPKIVKVQVSKVDNTIQSVLESK